MSKIENAIGWCDETTNAVTGCDKVSPGCKNCYAEAGTRARVLRAQGIETWGPHGVRHPVAQFAEKIRRLNKLCVCDKCHEALPIFVGGESGPDGKRRDCGVAAIESVARQCQAAGVPVFVKQDCAFKSGQKGRLDDLVWNLKEMPLLSIA